MQKNDYEKVRGCLVGTIHVYEYEMTDDEEKAVVDYIIKNYKS
tara:strand:+ start:3993 stop:4121 length:129 start_codon:yes stop_codon:yes gene_type:complete